MFRRGELMWAARMVLLVAVLVHAWAALEVARASWRARPSGYLLLASSETTYASRTMLLFCVLLALYVVYHLLDFTFGRVNPGYEPGNVYRNVLASFHVWPVAGAYIAAMAVLGLHIYHGLWSALQSLGLNRSPTSHWRRGVAATIAALIVGGYITIPVAVLAGLLR